MRQLLRCLVCVFAFVGCGTRFWSHEAIAQDIQPVRAAMDQRAKLPDPYLFTVDRLTDKQNGRPPVESSSKFQWREGAYAIIDDDEKDVSLAQVLNSRYAFKSIATYVGTKYLLSQFAEGAERFQLVDAWDKQRPRYRMDLYLLGKYAIQDVLAEDSCTIASNEKGLVEVKFKSQTLNDRLPKSVELVLDPSKAYLLTQYQLVEATGAEASWEVKEFVELLPGYEMPSLSKLTRKEPAASKAFITTETMLYSMQEPDLSGFMLAAFGHTEPNQEKKVEEPSSWMALMIGGIVVLIAIIIGIVRYRMILRND